MDFFDRQTHALKQTRRLLWLFILTILGVLVVNNVLLCPLVACFEHPIWSAGPAWHPANFIGTARYLFGEALVHPRHFSALVFRWPAMLGVSLGTLMSIAGGCYCKMRELGEGGAVVAEFLGGRRVAANTDAPRERQLRDVVEEMAIASGAPVPEIYILDCERGINAFAAGHTRDDMAIGVTRGCVELLAREELQGVIGHEFSHILNGDTRINMRIIGLAHGLFWPTLLGRALIYGRAEPGAGGGSATDGSKIQFLPTAGLGALFVMLGCLSLPFVRLIKSAICRQREWLADAAAVQFTRNPDGLAGALKKTGGLARQGRLDVPNAEVASHLYFVESGSMAWFKNLSTHPPLAARIAALAPGFDGTFPKVTMLEPNQAERDEAYARVVCQTMTFSRCLDDAVASIDRPPTSDHIRQAAVVRLALPEDLKSALRTPAGAENVVWGLLLSDDPAVRQRQADFLKARLDSRDFDHFTQVLSLIESLDDKFRLPLAEFAVPALRENDEEAHAFFEETLRQLIECDQALDLFEYTLMKMIRRQLAAHFTGPTAAAWRHGRARDVKGECQVLLSALAHVGNDEDEAAARKAFAAGSEFLDLGVEQIEYLPRAEWDLAGVDAALTTLATYHGPLRRNVLLACGKTVAADGHVTIREAELLRAIADSLDCPMPPFVEAIRGDELLRETAGR